MSTSSICEMGTNGCASQASDLSENSSDPMDEEEEDKDRFWWKHIPEGAAAIVFGLAAERALVDLLDKRLACPRSTNWTPRGPCDFDAVQRLVQEYPGLCHRSYDFQWDHNDTRTLTLLAVLCCLRAPLDLLELVFRTNPAAIGQTEPRKNCLPIHYLCTFEHPQAREALDFLHTQFPESIQLPRKDGMLPLQLAIYFHPSLAFIQHLVEVWPGALDRRDHDQWTVLHAAARSQAKLEIVQYLHSVSPESCVMVDSKRRTAFHLACRQRDNLNVVEFLLQQEPHVAFWEDHNMSTPLMCAARFQSVPVLTYLLDHYHAHAVGNGFLRDARHGASVLHYAALDNTVDVVQMLIQRYPTMVASRTQDRNRYYPLHLCCRHKVSLAILQALVEARPELLLKPCRGGRTPLEVAKCYNRSEDVIEYLTEQTTKVKSQVTIVS